MQIDPAKQEATLASQSATEQQKLAVYQYNQLQVERQRKLFAAGIISKDALDQAEQAYANSKADYAPASASRPRSRTANSPTTASPRPSTASSATSPSTSATTSPRPPCSPRLTRERTSKGGFISPPSAPLRYATVSASRVPRQYCGVCFALENVLKLEYGRKALVFFSDGVDNRSDATREQTLDLARQSDIPNPIAFTSIRLQTGRSGCRA